ncbi:MAG: metallophosphoesterase [Actinomycetota bacterium]
MRRFALPLILCAMTLTCISDAPNEAHSTEPELARARDGRYPGLDPAWNGPFFFLQLADTQFGMFDKDERWDKETALFTRAVEHINRLKPRFVIVCGDLVNQPAGTPLNGAQTAEFKRIARQISRDIPLVCVCGNHDVGNIPTPKGLAGYRRDFGDDWFSFQVAGIYAIVLNSSLIWDPSGAPDEHAKQDAWFSAELERAKASDAKHILVFQHHPWFLNKPDDADQYFTIPRVRRDPALALMRKAGVRAVFAGHYHRNAHGRDGAMEMITTSAVGMPLGKDPSGFRIVKVYETRLEHQYHGLEAVPERVEVR